MKFDTPQYSNSYLHDAAKHILAKKGKLDRWLCNVNSEIVANASLVLCLRENKMLQGQIQSQLESFKRMLIRIQKRGQMQGREFWGCSVYPKCNGTRPINLD